MENMKKLLILDDDPDILNIIRQLLKSENYEIDYVSSLEEAEKYLKEKRIDILICDYRIENSYSYNLITQIVDGNMNQDPKTPIVILSAYGPSIRKDLLDSPNIKVIHKPIITGNFLEAISQLMGGPYIPKLGQKKGNLLVVEDEEDILDLLTSITKDLGDEVYLAQNAEEALEICQKITIHAVASDLRMPGMDGLTMLGEIRSKGFEFPFIFITAYHTPENIAKAFELGCHNIIKKPYDETEVRDVLRGALRLGVELEWLKKSKKEAS
jgi:CheY-like chemotaxis protein